MSSTTPALTAERMRADVAGLLGCDPGELDDTENLFDRGLDSVRTMTLVETWRSAGAGTLEFPDLAERPELGYWITLVTGAAAAGANASGATGTGETA